MDRRDFLVTLSGTAAALKGGSADAIARALARAPDTAPDALAQDEDFWFAVRQQFTLDRNQLFLNSGTASPPPVAVQTALARYLAIQHLSPSLYAEQLLQPAREEVRTRLAAAAGCDREELAVTRNTTEAMQTAIFGLPLGRGDEVLSTTQDYPSLLTSWRQRERRDGVVLRTVRIPTPPPSPDAIADAILRAIGPRTRVLHLSHVTFTCGQILPIARLCAEARRRGIVTVIDGAHAFQHFPFRVADLGCDYFGTSLHKWTMAPLGTGFLYVRRDRIQGTWPLFGAPAAMDDDIRKFELVGTQSFAASDAVTEALEFQAGLGLERKSARLQALRARWQERVAALPRVRLLTPTSPEHGRGLGALEIAGIDGRALQDWLLRRHRIQVRQRVQEGEFSAVRVAVNVFTTPTELDRFVAAIETAATAGIA
jgi:selenocysteine lyase/cysteine desulfurase